MKRIIIALSLVFIIFGGLAPLVNGLLMEKTVRQAVENANDIYKESNTDYSLEIVKYDRTFRSSDIEWKINFGSMKAFYGIEEMTFVDQAKHGYTGVVSTTSLEKNPWFMNFINTTLQGNNPFSITTSYSLLGGIDSTFSFDAFSILIEEEVLEMEKGSFTIQTDNRMKKITTSGTWQGVHSGEKLKISGMTMDADFEMVSTFLWDGEVQFAMETLMVNEPQSQIELTDLAMKYKANVDQVKNLFSTESTFAMAKLSTDKTEVSGATATFVLRNMDAQGYEEFMDFYTQTVSEAVARSAQMTDNSQASQDALKEQLSNISMQAIGAFEKLLQAGLEFAITEVEIKLPEGDINGDFTLRLLKDMTLMQFAPVVGRPELILDIFYLKSDIELPASFAEEKPTLVVPIYPGMQGGLFVQDEDKLTHNSETRDGKLFVNGSEVILAR